MADEDEESEELLDDEEYQHLDDFLEEVPEENEGISGGEGGEEELQEAEVRRSPTASPPRASPSRTSARSGRVGPRSTSSAESSGGRRALRRDRDDHADSRDSRGSRTPDRNGGAARDAKRPRGNLPQAPVFDGDRKKNPRCFRIWANKVDTYVAIAEKIIDPGEIGLRLYAAIEGPAADYLEDVPAKTFGVPDGWKALLKLMQEKYDETRMSKVGAAMKSFFNLQVPNEGKALTLRDVVDYMDQAARQCRDAGLEIPDAVMIYFFFQHSNSNMDRQANLLLRTEGKYDWAKIKKAVELLYPNVVVRQPFNSGGKSRGRGAHEAQQVGQSDQYQTNWNWNLPDHGETAPAIEAWIYNNDPIEALADQHVDMTMLPEGLARDLHTCFASHRENRQKLSRAVQARGYYVKGHQNKGGKKGGKGKGGKGKGGKSKGGSKTRGGMSLEELKASTTCGSCGAQGHWHDDPECPNNRKSNVVANEEAVEDGGYEDDGTGEYYEEWNQEYFDEWADDWYEQDQPRSTNTAVRKPKVGAYARESLYEESVKVAKDLNVFKDKVLQKDTKVARPRDPQPAEVRQVQEALKSDDFFQAGGGESYQRAKHILEARKTSASSGSASHAAIAEVQAEMGKTFDEVGSVWDLLQKEKTPDIDSLRVRRPFMTQRVPRQVHYIDFNVNESDVRSANPSTRRPPTVQDGRLYLTIDTACENTVCGSYYAGYVDELLKGKFGLRPLEQQETEQYCFGPGPPKESNMRLSIPIGIGGKPCILRTSMIDEAQGSQQQYQSNNRIPFLAGQDWLHMMKAVIDMDENMVEFKVLGVRVPLEVDHSGHLVIAIDEFPESGWPPGLTTRVDRYPGEFSATKLSKDHTDTGVPSAYEERIPGGFKPNYFYEPNDDKLNTNIPRGPCSVQPDFWEFDYAHGLVVRHHNQPRTQLFSPSEVSDGPLLQQLRDDRITIVHGSGEDLRDSWRKNLSPGTLPAWTGKTCFFLLAVADINKIKLPHGQDIGVLIKHSALQTSLWVHPESLTGVGGKKILQFDLTAKTPVLEHAPSAKQQTFQIPPEQFGSDVVEARERLRRDAQGSMAKVGSQDGHLDRDRSQVGPLQHDDPRAQAPRTRIDGLCGEPHEAGDGANDACHRASLNDSSSGSDSEGAQHGLPRGSKEMSAHLGACSEIGQQAWQVPGVSQLWPHQEGLADGLQPPHHEGEGDGVRHHPRNSRRTRRKDHSNQPRFQGLFGQLGRLLLTLIAVSFGTIDEQQIFQDRYNPNQQSTTSWQPLQPGGLGDSRHGDGRGALDEFGPRPLRPGWKKRVQHCARRGALLSKTVRDAVTYKVAGSRWPRQRYGCDLVEIFGGTSMISLRASRIWGLKVLQPVDIRYGVDLRKRTSRRWLLRMLEGWRPRLAVVEFPCTPWTILQRNVNYRDRLEELWHRQELDRPFLKLTEQIFEGQVRRQSHALAENPATADSHHEPEIVRLRQKYYETTSCMCQFGMVGRHGGPLLKRVRWIGTHPHLIQALDRQCDFSHIHEKVEGGNTALSAQYPPDLADAIVKAYLEMVEIEDFGTHYTWDTVNVRDVKYVEVNKTEAEWRPLLQQAEEILARKAQHNIFLDPGTDLYKKIMPLVPWQIACIQLGYLPKAKRVRPGLEDCHRCSVLWQNDDTVLIESEHLPSAQAPREHFVTPVKVGIFVLGYAPGEPKEPSPARLPQVQVVPHEGEQVEDPLTLQVSLDEAMAERGLVRKDFAQGEMWFIGPPLRHEQRRLAPALVRLRRNLGHPRTEDLVRALAQNGKVDAEAI